MIMLSLGLHRLCNGMSPIMGVVAMFHRYNIFIV